MQPTLPELNGYADALEAYSNGRGEAALLEAYEIGRNAMAQSLGMLPVVSAHHAALEKLIDVSADPARTTTLLRMADEFLRQALSPFEMVHGGFREAAETTSAIVRFTGTLCHEIRTPLTSVLASAGMLQEFCEARLDDQERKLLANVLDGGNRIKRRTDELMDLIGLQSGSIALDYHEVDPTVFLSGVAQRLEPVAREAGLEMHVTLQERMPAQFTLDPDRLEQVISNLVNNAIKFGADGKSVELAATIKGPLQVEVRDHGRGIPAEAQANLFRPFHRASQAHHVPGMGLGLSLCKEIVTAHGGRIWLNSEVGTGTVVGFAIPDHAPSAE